RPGGESGPSLFRRPHAGGTSGCRRMGYVSPASPSSRDRSAWRSLYHKQRLAIHIPRDPVLSQVELPVRVGVVNPSPTERQLEGISLLSDPVRRRLYLYVVGQSGEVSREQAAGAVGITRPAAAFHLDKLVEEGLLEADYRRISGRRGPGAGRPAKVYRRAPRDLSVHVPPRDYELVARFLLRGLDPKRPGKALQGAHQAAWEFG